MMLSGIGPKEQLDALKIKVLLQQPFVGKGMADNPMNALFIPSPIAIEPSMVEIVGITRFGSYIEAGGDGNFIFTKSPNYQGYSPQMGGFIFEKTKGPLSMGRLIIQNRNPHDNPFVTFNYFKEPEDLIKCVKGLRTILNAVKSKAFSTYTYANMTAKDILDLNLKLPGTDLIRSYASSPIEAYYALRVIDGSTILNTTGTNPQASVLMLGRELFIYGLLDFSRVLAESLILILYKAAVIGRQNASHEGALGLTHASQPLQAHFLVGDQVKKGRQIVSNKLLGHCVLVAPNAIVIIYKKKKRIFSITI